MKGDFCGGPMTEQGVTYRIELQDKLVVVENVPAKVCIQCGERLYSAEIVERLQQTVWEQKAPSKVLSTPVFDFSEA